MKLKAWLVTDTSNEWGLDVIAATAGQAKTMAMGLDYTDCGFTDYIEMRAKRCPYHDYLAKQAQDQGWARAELLCEDYVSEFVKSGRCKNCTDVYGCDLCHGGDDVLGLGEQPEDER